LQKPLRQAAILVPSNNLGGPPESGLKIKLSRKEANSTINEITRVILNFGI
jgi:hypothetical protein